MRLIQGVLAVSMLILGPAIFYLGLFYSLRDDYLVSRKLDPFLQLLANASILIGPAVLGTGLIWLATVAASNYRSRN